MKKACIIVLALLLTPFIVFGGGGRQAASSEKAPASFLTPPGQLPLVTQPATITLGLHNQPPVSDWYNNFFTKYVQNKTGLTLKFENFPFVESDAVTQFELMVASGQKLPDILAINIPNWRDHGENGVFVDLNPYFEKYAYFYNKAMDILKAKYGDDREERRIKIKTSSFSGKRFAYPAYNDHQSDLQMHTTMINKVWLDNLGLKIPATTQELKDVLIAFRDRDPNGNGRRDEIPMLGHSNTWHGDIINWLVNAFVYWHPDGTNAGVINVTNGKIWVPYATDEYRDALRYIRGLVSDRLLSDMSFSTTDDDITSLLNPGDNVFTVGISSGHPVIYWRTGSSAVDYYVCQPSVTGPGGVNYAPVDFPILQGGPYAFITKDAQYPDVAFRLLDFFSDEYTGMLMRYGEEGVDWERVDPSKNMAIEGFPARFSTPNLLWGATSQNQNWRQCLGYFQIDPYSAFFDDGSWEMKREKIFHDYISMNAGKQPKELVDEVIFTTAEADSIREIQSTLWTYVKEQQALFCTGQRDVERDWNAYLSELDRIGLKRYLEVVQKAYTRTISN